MVEHRRDDRANLIDQNRIGLNTKQLQIRPHLRFAAHTHERARNVRMFKAKTNRHFGDIDTTLAAQISRFTSRLMNCRRCGMPGRSSLLSQDAHVQTSSIDQTDAMLLGKGVSTSSMSVIIRLYRL